MVCLDTRLEAPAQRAAFNSGRIRAHTALGVNALLVRKPFAMFDVPPQMAQIQRPAEARHAIHVVVRRPAQVPEVNGCHPARGKELEPHARVGPILVRLNNLKLDALVRHDFRPASVSWPRLKRY